MDTDAAAFPEFYSSARDDCLRVVLATVRDRPAAEDLVAEAFARAWASWRQVSRHPAPRAWVVRTALNAHRCRLFLDLDTAQTAQTIGIASGTVTAHLARAIETLRGEFAHPSFKE